MPNAPSWAYCSCVRFQPGVSGCEYANRPQTSATAPTKSSANPITDSTRRTLPAAAAGARPRRLAYPDVGGRNRRQGLASSASPALPLRVVGLSMRAKATPLACRLSTA
jgi:hypothetical protein